jgi:hypothetical protein
LVSEDSFAFSQEESFEKVILQTIDNVLKKVLGEGVANIITIYAKKGDHSKWEEDPERVKALLDALRDLVGLSSRIVEHMILKNLYSLLELNFEEKANYDFFDYIRELRKRQIDRNNSSKHESLEYNRELEGRPT